MKKRNKTILIGAACLFFCSEFVASASPVVKQLIATVASDMTIKIDGVELQAKDSTGADVTPVIIDGKTYLPVRALAQALKVGVDYDNNTRTISIGEKSDFIPYTQDGGRANNGKGFSTDKPQFLTVGEKTFKYGIVQPDFGAAQDNYYFTPNAKYQKFYVDLVFVPKDGKSDHKAEITFDDQNSNVLKKMTIDANAVVSVELDVAGLNNLAMRATGDSYDNTDTLILGEPRYK